MAERSRQHRRRVIGDVAAIGGEHQIEPLDGAVVVEADVITEIERMPLAGRAHVVVARKPELHRATRFPGKHRGDARDDRRLAFLAAEAAAHAAHLHRHRIERNAEHMRDAVLHFGRMLGRREDMEVAAFAGRRDRDLAFEIEVILPAAVEFALAGDASQISARRRYRRDPSSGSARHGFRFATASCDGEHWRKDFVFHLHELCRGAREIERRGRYRRHHLTFMLDEAGREQRLVGADRRDVVLAGNVAAR